MINYSMKTIMGFLFCSLLGIFSLFVVIGMMPNGSATTFVEGHIESNTTWTEVDSPYVVSKDIFVDEGATLNIDPGVEVKFGQNFKIDVQGNLSAIGSKSKMILFTSNKNSPDSNDWNTIKFGGGSNEKFEIRYCIIEFAESGITMGSGQGTSVIEYSEFRNNVNGFKFITNVANFQISNCTIKNNVNGILSSEKSIDGIRVMDNEIYNNTEYGIRLVNPGGYSELWISICRNEMYLNGKDGVSIFSNDRDLRYIEIRANNIFSNGNDGISLFSDEYHLRIIKIGTNVINNNGNNGIFLHSEYRSASSDGDAIITNSSITNNTIYSNGINGIFLDTRWGYNRQYTHIYIIDISYNY